MTQQQLIEALKQTLTKTKVNKLTALSLTDAYSIEDLLATCFHEETEIAFRAAWILEQVQQVSPERFLPILLHFTDAYPRQQNHSCQRHFTKILMDLLKKRAFPPGFDYTPLIEATFEWLAHPEVPVAVKANCMSVLFSLRRQDDWIEEELRAQIEFLMRDGLPSIQSRGKKILSMLASN
ncbi:hypothetical protein [Arcticibacter sp. MXS-1]|uniref:hypothetical protein n=1 Tax=Arcticibacter sp. MXS-1 TaxID=3341726 RepID=UPI0035A901C6